jgi:hypothetical protein
MVTTLSTRRIRGGRARAVAVGHDLGDAVVIAQVDEQHAAMIALAMDPAREADILADMLAREGAAGVGTIRVHRNSFQSAAIRQVLQA